MFSLCRLVEIMYNLEIDMVINYSQVDVFSFGIVMWELVTGEEPYADLHYGAIIGIYPRFSLVFYL